MTIFGIDISEHQNGLSLVRARDEGISFAIIRTTDGTYRDSCYRSHVEDGKNAGLPLAAYHYLRHPAEGTSIEQQVATAVDVMGEHRLPIWLDCETPTRLSEQHVQRAKQCFEDRGIRVLGVYSYVPYWEGMAGGEPATAQFGHVWVAAYGRNDKGNPADVYPGDHDRQWSYPLGNQTPVMWQFNSNARVAGYEVDVNAYRGSVDELRALFEGASAPASAPAPAPAPTGGEPKVLDYPRDQVTQDTFYNCGPASTQTIVRAATGVLVDEAVLAHELGTTVNGTDYIGLITRVLRNRLPEADYTTVEMPTDPPTLEQRDKLWADIVNSIDAGYGVVCNIVAPPSNYPRGVYGSASPSYRGGVVYHYIAAMGYRDDGQGRAVWIADSGFSPYGYWLSLDQLSTLIPPKGYTYAAANPKKESIMNTDQLILDQLVGYEKRDGLPTFNGWPQLGGRTLVDAIAAIGAALDVPGCYDPKKEGK